MTSSLALPQNPLEVGSDAETSDGHQENRIGPLYEVGDKVSWVSDQHEQESIHT